MTSVISYSPSIERGHPDTPSANSNPPSPEHQKGALAFPVGSGLSAFNIPDDITMDTPRFLGLSTAIVKNLQEMFDVAEDLMSARPNSIVFESVPEESDPNSPQDPVSPQEAVTPPRAPTPPAPAVSARRSPPAPAPQPAAETNNANASQAAATATELASVAPMKPSPRVSPAVTATAPMPPAPTPVPSVTAAVPVAVPAPVVAAIAPAVVQQEAKIDAVVATQPAPTAVAPVKPLELSTAAVSSATSMPSARADSKRSSSRSSFALPSPTDSDDNPYPEFNQFIQAMNQSTAQLASVFMAFMKEDGPPSAPASARTGLTAASSAENLVVAPVAPVAAAVVTQPQPEPEAEPIKKLSPPAAETGLTSAPSAAPVPAVLADEEKAIEVLEVAPVDDRSQERPQEPVQKVSVPEPQPVAVTAPEQLVPVAAPAAVDLLPLHDPLVLSMPQDIAASIQLTEPITPTQESVDAAALLATESELHAVTGNLLNGQLPTAVTSPIGSSTPRVVANSEVVQQVAQEIEEKENELARTKARMEARESEQFTIRSEDLEAEQEELSSARAGFDRHHSALSLERQADLDRLKELEEKIKVLEKQLQDKDLQLERAAQDLEAQKRLVAEKDAKIADLEVRLKKLEDAWSRTEKELRQVLDQRDRKDQVINELKAAIKKTENEKCSLEEKFVAMGTHRLEQEKLIAAQTRKLDDLSRTVHALITKRNDPQPNRRLSKVQIILLIQLLLLFLYVITDWGSRQVQHRRVFT